MSKQEILSILAVSLAWTGLAHAQQMSADLSFGTQLAAYSPQVWFIVFGFGAIGVVIRLLHDSEADEELSLMLQCRKVLRLFMFGELAAFALFALFEMMAANFTVRVPDLFACLFFTLGALFHEDVISRMRNRMNRLIDGAK